LNIQILSNDCLIVDFAVGLIKLIIILPWYS